MLLDAHQRETGKNRAEPALSVRREQIGERAELDKGGRVRAAPTEAQLHERAIDEIADQFPKADEREMRLRVAIRESTSMTVTEEDQAFLKIWAALQ